MITDRWEQVKSIFGAAVELPEEQRPVFVEQACLGDLDLHAEVLSLLAANQSMGDFLDHPLMHDLSHRSADADHDRLRPGDTLCDRFEILDFLGEGGMGRVYKAWDRDLGVCLALKTIRPEISSDPRVIELFKHEIQLARQVTHFNVCRIFDLGQHRSGSSRVTFLTMELLDGETLENHIQRLGALSIEQTMPIIRQMADGLTAIHQVSVVHRDFKPANVLLTNSGKIRVVISDFGLARVRAFAVITESIGSSPNLTGIAGTPAYMAPEQFIGGEISPATDIYALGLVTYRMLTGRLPVALSTRRNHLEDLAYPPLEQPALSNSAWNKVILRCLEQDPALRFQSAREFMEALEADVRENQASVQITGAPPELIPLRKPIEVLRLARLIPWAIVVTALLVLSMIAVDYFIRNGVRGNTGSVELTPLTSDARLTWGPSLSADGTLLAYSSDRKGTGNLNIWIKNPNLSDDTAVQITHDTSDATSPALSPQGDKVAYRSERDGGGIYVVDVKSHDARFLVKQGRNPRFSPDGKWIAYWVGVEHNLDDPFRAGGTVFTISANGGTPTPVQPDFADARYPAWSSDGHSILFQGARQRKNTFEEASDWWIESLNTHTAEPTGAFAQLRRKGLILYSCPIYWLDKKVIFAARTSFATTPFELRLSDGAHATSSPVQISGSTRDDIEPWVSNTGRLVVSDTIASVGIWRMSGNRGGFGEPTEITDSSVVDSALSVSSDGKRMAFHRRIGAAEQVYLQNLDSPTGELTMVPTPTEKTPGVTGEAIPIISHDGSRVVYSFTEGARHPIYAYLVADMKSRQLCEDCGILMDTSPDNSRILYSLPDNSIGMLDLPSGRKSEIMKSDTTILEQASFSPDGRWIAFVSATDEEHTQIRIAPVENKRSQPRWTALTSGDTRDLKPIWSSAGTSIYYISNRDSFNCVWQLHLSLGDKHLAASPIPVRHFHAAYRSMMHLSIETMDLALGGQDLFTELANVTGNIYSGDLKPALFQ